jgi:hypothetical protein
LFNAIPKKHVLGCQPLLQLVLVESASLFWWEFVPPLATLVLDQPSILLDVN